MKKFTLAVATLFLLFMSACGPAGKKNAPEVEGTVTPAPATSPATKPEADKAKGSAFSAKDYDDVGDFVRVKNRNPQPTVQTDSKKETQPSEVMQAPEYIVTKTKTYPLKRERLKLRDVKYRLDSSGQTLSLLGEVVFDKEQVRPFELEGVVEKGLVSLVVKDQRSDLKNVLKARGTCFSNNEDSAANCKEFYVDFYYFDRGVIYTDQIIPKQLVENIYKEIQQNQTAESDESGFADEVTAGAEVIEGQAQEDENDPSEAPLQEALDSELQPGGYFAGNTGQDIAELFPQLVGPQVAPQPVAPKKAAAAVAPKQALTKPAQPKQALTKPPPKAVLVAPPARPSVVVVRPDQPLGQRPNPELPSVPLTRAQDIINPNMFEVAGRPENQAIGRVDAGRLKNPTSLMDLINKLGPTYPIQVFDRVISQRKFFGTWDLVVLIQKMVQWVKQSFPGQYVSVGNVAKQVGGRTSSGQISHQNGLDADIAYLTTDRKPSKMNYVVDFAKDQVRSDFLIEKQWALFKKIHASQAVDIIIVDPVIKIALCKKAVALGEFKNPESRRTAIKVLSRMYSDQKYRFRKQNGKRVYTRNKMHANHFHLRIKCGGHHRQCYQYRVADQPMGCEIKN
jgi:hypothetical protein